MMPHVAELLFLTYHIQINQQMCQSCSNTRAYGVLVIKTEAYNICRTCLEENTSLYCIIQPAICLKGWIINRRSGKERMDRDGVVSLSADYSTEDRLNRNS